MAADHARIMDKIYTTHNYYYHVSNLKIYFEDLSKHEWFTNCPGYMTLGQGGFINGSPLLAIHTPAVQTKIGSIVYSFQEAGNYRKDNEIGDFVTGSPWAFIMALVCHELAHVFQILYSICSGIPDSSGHGAVFQSQYRLLRNKYVNPVLLEEYKNLLTLEEQLAKR